MCGRRKIEREYPKLANWGDMDYEMVKSISEQLPENIVIQFHNNGEPLLYDCIGEAFSLFTHQIRCLDTNGKLLIEKASEIIDNLETITISTFHEDPEASDQAKIVSKFLELKGDRKPNVIIRQLGNAKDFPEYDGLIKAKRQLHKPEGSFGYKSPPTIPEIGICLDLLNHMAIKSTGLVLMCVRFDPLGLGVIGDAKQQSLESIWNGEYRQMVVKKHIQGKRDEVALCKTCEYWGIATS
tara:strand:- start:1916 stop:2635 length:720 start_codon:yes stop_codon:yes gene_type:complete